MSSGLKAVYSRRPIRDPRTVARDIPGIFDVLFPQLTVGMVAHLNENIRPCVEVNAVPFELTEASTLRKAMLFEVAFARAQQILAGSVGANWSECLQVATNRQKRHFDAVVPSSLSNVDKRIAEWVGHNLAHMLQLIQSNNPMFKLVHSPSIVGYQWIDSGEGDFSVGTHLIEVKCTNKKFGSADYRQILMYWVLSYASAIERGSNEWTRCILLNPRLNYVLDISFDEIIRLSASRRSKVELIELFSFVVGEYGLKAQGDFDL